MLTAQVTAHAVNNGITFDDTVVRYGVGFAVLGVLSVVLSASDVRSERIPNTIVLGSIALVLLWQVMTAITTHAFNRLALALVVAALMFFVTLTLALLRPQQLGGGDVKLFALFGLVLGWFGWEALGVALLVLTMLLGAVFLVAAFRGVASMSKAIPLAPIAVVAMWAGIVGSSLSFSSS